MIFASRWNLQLCLWALEYTSIQDGIQTLVNKLCDQNIATKNVTKLGFYLFFDKYLI